MEGVLHKVKPGLYSATTVTTKKKNVVSGCAQPFSLNDRNKYGQSRREKILGKTLMPDRQQPSSTDNDDIHIANEGVMTGP